MKTKRKAGEDDQADDEPTLKKPRQFSVEEFFEQIKGLDKHKALKKFVLTATSQTGDTNVISEYLEQKGTCKQILRCLSTGDRFDSTDYFALSSLNLIIIHMVQSRRYDLHEAEATCLELIAKNLKRILALFSTHMSEEKMTVLMLLATMNSVSSAISKEMMKSIQLDDTAMQLCLVPVNKRANPVRRPFMLFLISFMSESNSRLMPLFLAGNHLRHVFKELAKDDAELICSFLRCLRRSILENQVVPKKSKIDLFLPSVLAGILGLFSWTGAADCEAAREERTVVYEAVTEFLNALLDRKSGIVFKPGEGNIPVLNIIKSLEEPWANVYLANFLRNALIAAPDNISHVMGLFSQMQFTDRRQIRLVRILLQSVQYPVLCTLHGARPDADFLAARLDEMVLVQSIARLVGNRMAPLHLRDELALLLEQMLSCCTGVLEAYEAASDRRTADGLRRRLAVLLGQKLSSDRFIAVGLMSDNRFMEEAFLSALESYERLGCSKLAVITPYQLLQKLRPDRGVFVKALRFLLRRKPSQFAVLTDDFFDVLTVALKCYRAGEPHLQDDLVRLLAASELFADSSWDPRAWLGALKAAPPQHLRFFCRTLKTAWAAQQTDITARPPDPRLMDALKNSEAICSLGAVLAAALSGTGGGTYLDEVLVDMVHEFGPQVFLDELQRAGLPKPLFLSKYCSHRSQVKVLKKVLGEEHPKHELAAWFLDDADDRSFAEVSTDEVTPLVNRLVVFLLLTGLRRGDKASGSTCAKLMQIFAVGYDAAAIRCLLNDANFTDRAFGEAHDADLLKLLMFIHHSSPQAKHLIQAEARRSVLQHFSAKVALPDSKAVCGMLKLADFGQETVRKTLEQCLSQIDKRPEFCMEFLGNLLQSLGRKLDKQTVLLLGCFLQQNFDATTPGVWSGLCSALKESPHCLHFLDRTLFAKLLQRENHSAEMVQLLVLMLRHDESCAEYISEDLYRNNPFAYIDVFKLLKHSEMHTKYTVTLVRTILQNADTESESLRNYDYIEGSIGKIENMNGIFKSSKLLTLPIATFECARLSVLGALLKTLCQKAAVRKKCLSPFVAQTVRVLHKEVKSLTKDSEASEKPLSLLLDVARNLLDSLQKIEKVNEQFLSETSSHAEWQKCMKNCLKYGLKERTIFLKVVRLLLRFTPSEEQSAVFFGMMLSHSSFLKTILSASEMQTELVEILARFCQLNPSLMAGKHLPFILGAYNASCSRSDRLLLKLMQQYESAGVDFQQYRPQLWGPAAVAKYSVTAIENAIIGQTRCGEVLNLLQRKTVMYTINQFPFHRPLDLSVDVQIKEFSIYDPAFYLLLFYQILAPEMEMPYYLFTRSNALALTAVCLGSDHEDVRNLARAVLERFRVVLHAALRGKDREMWLQYVDTLCLQQKAISRFAAIFMGFAGVILANPTHGLFKRMATFINVSYKVDLQEAPEFLVMLRSPDLGAESQVSFILNICHRSLHTDADYHVLLKHNYLSAILDLFLSHYALPDQRTAILKIIKACAGLPKAVVSLLHQCSILQWLFAAQDFISDTVHLELYLDTVDHIVASKQCNYASLALVFGGLLAMVPSRAEMCTETCCGRLLQLLSAAFRESKQPLEKSDLALLNRIMSAFPPMPHCLYLLKEKSLVPKARSAPASALERALEEILLHHNRCIV